MLLAGCSLGLNFRLGSQSSMAVDQRLNVYINSKIFIAILFAAGYITICIEKQSLTVLKNQTRFSTMRREKLKSSWSGVISLCGSFSLSAAPYFSI
jgi:hypothetical protein